MIFSTIRAPRTCNIGPQVSPKEVLLGVQPVKVEQPAKYVDFAWHLRFPGNVQLWVAHLGREAHIRSLVMKLARWRVLASVCAETVTPCDWDLRKKLLGSSSCEWL